VHCAHELTAFPAEDTKRMAELFRLTNLERE
jgi:hypothetical protein